MSSTKILNSWSSVASLLIITVLVMAPLNAILAEENDLPTEGSVVSETAVFEDTAQSTPSEMSLQTGSQESSAGNDEVTMVNDTSLSVSGSDIEAVPHGNDNESFGGIEGTSGSDVQNESGEEPTEDTFGSASNDPGTVDEHDNGGGQMDLGAQEVILEVDAVPTLDTATASSETGGSVTIISSTTTPAAPSTEAVVDFQSSTTSSTPAASSTVNNISTLSEAPTNNLASGTGTPTIVTGDSVALANVINLVNTNFVNSEGVIVFDNFFETLFGDFDLRNMYSSLTDFGCSLVSCSQHNVTTNISNEAVIKNALVIEALTGRNTVDGGSSTSIKTGDAFAGLNLINVVNTNVIDSNYLLVTMNAFKNVEGDIVFPSLSNFFNKVGNSVSPNALNISNAASVVNNVAVSAESGSNEAEGTQSSHVTTGESTASTNVFNQLNTSLVGGQSLSMVFRVHGNWAGEIFGAPSNLAWTEDGEGGLYLFDTASSFGAGGDNLTLNATNSASIQNDVSVVALTGENAITGAETALISTGNAYAGANIMNVANATVVGRNWILAIVNILGDFNGNISFGRPDLWVGAQVDVPSVVENGSILTYRMTVINNGDADASNVQLIDDYDESYIDILESSVPFSTNGAGKVLWDIGKLQPGMATEITYNARVKNTSYNTDITNLLSVVEREPDDNSLDNSDTITVTTSARPQRTDDNERISLSEVRVPSADIVQALEIDRLTSSTTINGEDRESTQELILTNTSNKNIRSVVLHDVLVDPSGVMVKDEAWELGDVLPYEEVRISYKVAFSSSAPEGRYYLSTKVDGVGSEPLHADKNGHITLIGVEKTPTAMVGGDTPNSQVLGVSITREEPEERNAHSFLSFVIPTAEAATRIDHGLPMTHVPYRYSLYFFILAIVLSNVYYMVRKTNGNNLFEE